MFTLAHLSDPHLGPLPQPSLKALMGKRILGYLSWQRQRKKQHRPDVLAALGRDLQQLSPDHIVVTGDITNISLPDEFSQAALWLQTLGTSETVSVIPGNHDAYVAVPWAQSWAHWQAFMTCEAEAGSVRTLEDFGQFPFIRRRGPLALVGLSSAHPTAPFLAGGSLGDAQRQRLATLLRQLGDEGLCRVVLIHHPPHFNALTGRKGLWDSADFVACLQQEGAELVLHGHQHRFNRAAIDSPSGSIPVLGVPSASAVSAGKKPQAHYFLHDIAQQDGTWSVTTRVRAYRSDSGNFEEAKPAEFADQPA